MKQSDFKNLNFSLLGRNCILEGDFIFTGDTIIGSQVKGQITIKDEGRLTLERNSQVEGTIVAHDVEVFGSFKGTIKASGTLTVRSSAEISGNIEASKLSVYPGAVLNIEGHTPEQEIVIL